MKDCDMTDGEYNYELRFTSDKEMDEYIKVKFDNNKKEKQKARKTHRKVK